MRTSPTATDHDSVTAAALLVRGGRKRKEEGGTLAGRALDPNAAAVALDNPAADGEADAGAGVLIGMGAFEDVENPLLIARIDPNAIIGDSEFPKPLLALGRDLD